MNAARHAVDDDWAVLAGDLDGGHRLCMQLPARLYREGNEHVASLVDYPINAFGATAEEAVAQLKREIVGHFLWLEDAGDKLTPRLAREREQLRLVAAEVA